ncbi:HTH_38 domain-containing protein [Trichonephila clavipes]|nr:HTH_38 domain-containing protein [Trichonephila clavipes]
MPLGGRSHYQQLTKFERGRAIGLREGGFSFRNIAEKRGRIVSTVHDCWEQWSRDGTASRSPGSWWLRGTTQGEDVVFGAWLWGIILRLWQKLKRQLIPQ